jgi:Vacuolar sorting protein 9 (VPS9) domain
MWLHGVELTCLDSATVRSPADKAAIMVEAHKIVVGTFTFYLRDQDVYGHNFSRMTDGLSTLPPIRLSDPSENENVNKNLASENIANDKKQGEGDKEKEEEEDDVDDDEEEEEEGEEDLPSALFQSDEPSGVFSPTPGLDVPSDPELDPPCPPNPPPTQKSPRKRVKGKTPTLAPTPSLTTYTKPTPISSDILFPLLIFSVVKANPPHFVSHLLYTQRFRNQSSTLSLAYGEGEDGGGGGKGEEGYCVINLMAVAEFLENVDMRALGLGEHEGRVIRCVILLF